MTTRELVDALVAGDSVAIEQTFNDVMAQKVSSALDTYRVQVAQSLFDTQQSSTDNTDTE